ncbi:putative sporulation transcription regulator WhiA [Clostridiales bacterium]|nr:putative sporulation transcription regulator WhiA [Clostridiales bacterium]
MAESYSRITKEAILENIPKKKCCQRIRQDALDLAAITDADLRAEKISSAPEHFRCGTCPASFAAGLFVSFGSVTNPDKQYHLELSFETAAERDAAETILTAAGVCMKSGRRGSRHLLYIKSSSEIEDFLAFTGATHAAFDLMNAKIVREVRGNANRQMNCDMANISKSLAAAQQYTNAISEILRRGYEIRLPEELRQTARLRCENPQASMAELGQLHIPPITKSGVKHRLDKILRFYENLKEQESE